MAMEMHQLSARLVRLLPELTKYALLRSVPVKKMEIAEKGSNAFVPFENGATWGEASKWWDFRFTVTVPNDFEGKVQLRLTTGKEGGWEALNPQFVCRVGGQIWQAFDTQHNTMLLQAEAEPGETFEILLNGYADRGQISQDPPRLLAVLEDIFVPMEQLVYDIKVPYEAALISPPGDRDREVTLEVLASALDLLDIRQPGSPAMRASVLTARAYLREAYYGPRAALPPIAQAEAVGHTHIDVAWLWDLEQTRHKAVRSFATVLHLMKQYPEYKFMSSQAVLYNMVKEDEPELYARIGEAIKAGRWEPEGGMWVEADCNLASGESLIRQFLHGQRFFTEEFGKRSRILWLPDVFGYSAALPQIMRLCGIEYFMTTKLSWSEFNLSPYDTFRWKGIDGSEVLTHFSPSRDFSGENHNFLAYFTTYNAMLKPSQMAGGWQRFQQKGVDDHFLVSYGYGDGGGGPTDWMLENGRRMATPLPNTPAVSHQHALPFFEALERRVGNNPLLPKWSGELYLEYHRGTYTAMARNKRDNRRSELLLREVELWSAYAARQAGFAYPMAELRAIWQDVLTLQFHDILPGSSIKKVYDDSAETYGRLLPQLEAMKLLAQQALAAALPGDVLAFNSLSYERDDLLTFAAPAGTTALRDAAGTLYPAQEVEGRYVAFVKNLAPMTATPLWFATESVAQEALKLTRQGFETPFYSGAFDAALRIVSLVDKRQGREIAKPGEALNRIVCYENKPHQYDAWDINIYYDRRHWDVEDVRSVEVVSVGPVLAKLRVTYGYLSSTIQQDIVLYHDLPRIDFVTEVDWREKQYLLKAHFPVDLLYNEASFDIQYGNVKRATHKNTTWDIARFEVCAHKWADVSEAGYGVALLNDCKYGHSVDEHSLALTLLKSSTDPNPEADLEVHHFTYALLPHAEGWREAGVIQAGYQLNVPVSVLPGTAGKTGLPALCGVSLPNVLIEAVKGAEDGDGLIIRLYECHGRRIDSAVLNLGFAPKQVTLVNALEEKIADAALSGQQVTFAIKPYEIKTFRVK